jgi:hypothetical protein
MFDRGMSLVRAVIAAIHRLQTAPFQYAATILTKPNESCSEPPLCAPEASPVYCTRHLGSAMICIKVQGLGEAG